MDNGSIRAARVSLFVGLVVFLITGVVWRLGWLQPAELWIYDCFVAGRSNAAVDPRIIIVAQSEHDIDSLDYPLRDSVLARLLEKIEAGNPTVVGLDLYRDLPQPRDRSELASLDSALAHDNIVAIFFAGGESPFQIPPPNSLRGDRLRYGFNNFMTDGKTLRRGCISARLADGKTYNSFAALVATDYLLATGVDCGMDGKNVRLGRTVVPRFHSDDGGYIHANETGCQFLLDFRGPRQFPTMSVLDVLNLKDSGVFRDKIVLIGSTASSSGDIDETPVDSFAAGVVIHGQTINQLLRVAIDGDRPVETASLGFRWFSLVLWCAAGVGAGFFVRSHLLFAAAVLIGSAAVVLMGWCFFIGGYWTLVAAPLAGFLATAIFVKGYAARHEERERANLMKLFSQHISPAVAQEIWNQRHLFLQGGRPAPQRLMVTALFTDLKNYSTISEKMSPAELIAWVNECTGALAQHVGKNGGFISTYMGDGMMAVFGVPVARTTEEEIKRDATSAVRCALNMENEIKAMNARWKQEGKPLAGLRVGIFTGEAMAGVLGSEDHLEYSVIGDTINTASRLESVDKEGQWTGGGDECRILIGQLTHRYIEDIYTSRYVGKINLKGKAEITEVYKVFNHVESNLENQPNAYENAARPV